jgi:hypothetical protein
MEDRTSWQIKEDSRRWKKYSSANIIKYGNIGIDTAFL